MFYGAFSDVHLVYMMMYIVISRNIYVMFYNIFSDILW